MRHNRSRSPRSRRNRRRSTDLENSDDSEYERKWESKKKKKITEDDITEYLAKKAQKKALKVAKKLKSQMVSGYANDSNPFGDSNLNETIIWRKKIERDVTQGVPLEMFSVKEEKRRHRERMTLILYFFLFIFGFGLLLWWRRRHNQHTFFDVKDRHHEEVSLGNLKRDRISLVYGDNVKFTWRDTFERCIRLASALTHLGISRGDVELPVKIVFPRNLLGGVIPGNNATDFMMLGLGDMAIPSMLLALVLCFDHRKGKSYASPLDLPAHKGHKYIWYALSGYAIGLVIALAAGILTHSPQPALLYLVPSTLGPIIIISWMRRELTELWEGTQANTNDKANLTEV